MGLMEVSAENQELSKARLEICAACPMAKESKFLKIIKGSMNELDAIYCTVCSCPCNEKSLVTGEICPQNKW